jgi:hypothetical protein
MPELRELMAEWRKGAPSIIRCSIVLTDYSDEFTKIEHVCFEEL